jgi:glycosyltransferase involved in cell wall biosynthesis
VRCRISLLLSILVPCYNEEDSIGEVLSQLRSVALPLEREVIVIDDGSTDKSVGILTANPSVKIVKHDRNMGKGAAIRTGIEHAKGDLLLIQDADLEYSPEDIPKLVKPILENRADLVLGSRMRGTRKGMSFSHTLGNLVLSLVTTILFGKLVTDVMTGYKLLTREMLLELKLTSSDFAVETELVAKALRRGYRLREVPIRYVSRRNGFAKVSWKHGFTSLGQLLVQRAQTYRPSSQSDILRGTYRRSSTFPRSPELGNPEDTTFVNAGQ